MLTIKSNTNKYNNNGIDNLILLVISQLYEQFNYMLTGTLIFAQFFAQSLPVVNMYCCKQNLGHECTQFGIGYKSLVVE